MNISIFHQVDDSNKSIEIDSHVGAGMITFDTSGNMYIDYGTKIYQICINKNNDIYLDYANYDIISSDSIEYGYIMESRESSNKETVTDIIEPDNDNEYDSDGNEYQDENDPFGAVGDNYFVEEKNHMFSIPTSDYFTPQFYFCKLSGTNDIPVVERNNGDVNALYDVFIYHKNKCSFRSKLIGEPPLYVVKVYSDYINLRDIYDIHNSKSYKIVFDGVNINLNKF